MLKIAKLCKQYVVGEGLEFSFKGDPISYDDIFKDDGLFASIVKRAEANSVVCLGYGLGAHYNIDDDALLGIKIDFDTNTPNSLRLFFMIDVIKQIEQAGAGEGGDGAIALDELLYD